ncbi:MAG: hypothetical protein Q9184_002545 [Pyrenodesmia sp. 2 TL-2023]
MAERNITQNLSTSKNLPYAMQNVAYTTETRLEVEKAGGEAEHVANEHGEMTDVGGGKSTEEEEDDKLGKEDHGDEVYSDKDDSDEEGADDESEETADEEAESAEETADEEAESAEEDEDEDKEEEEEDEEEQYWAPKEEMVAGGIIKDPRPVASTSKPGPGAQAERAKLAERFWKKWSFRAPNTYALEVEDEFLLIHATRHGVTPKAIFAKDLLKSGAKNDDTQVRYRINQLKGKGIDVTPRTREQAWRETKARTTARTPLQQEADTLKAAILRGETLDQIVAARIVTLSGNTRGKIRHRWDTWVRNGQIPTNFPPK